MNEPHIEPTITIPLHVAHIISSVFLPRNPNKLRSATPEVKAAVIEYKRALDAALRAHGFPD